MDTKEKIKELSARLGIAIIIFGVVYLLGAFVVADFNAMRWDMAARLAVAFVGGFLAFMVAAYPFGRFTS